MASVSRRGLLAGAAAFALIPRARAAGGWAMKNLRLLCGDGTELEGGIRVEGGKIVALGPAVADGEDGGGSTLYPGIWCGGSPLGLYEIDLEAATHDESESSDAITPQARVVDGYNPHSEVIPVARLQGVMGNLCIPGGGSLVSGEAAWMRTTGDTTADATLLADAGLCFNLGHAATGGLPGAPKSRMGVAMKLRDLFDANAPKKDEAPTGKKKKCDPEKKEEEKKTRAQKAVEALLRRDKKAIFAADKAEDILAALDLAKEFSLDALVLGAAEGHLVAQQLAAAKVPVLLGPITVQPGGWDSLHARYENAALLHAAGVRFGLRGPDPHTLRDLTTEAGIAVANGLPHGAAIAAMCGNGPSFWNLEQGVLKVGREATFVRTDGDPLQPRTRVMGIWSRGMALPMVSRQTVLYERFKELK